MSAKQTIPEATGTPSAQADSAGGTHRYLDPRVLSRVRRLDLRTRFVVEGFLSGLHHSPYQGLSVEFAQHREYTAGDDTRFIDWKVYARSDRYFVKQYESDTNLRCTFMVDVSGSMKFAGATRRKEGLTKFDYAACVTASLAHLLLRQQDAVGLVTFDADWVTHLAPSTNPNQIKAFCRLLEQAAGSLKAKTSIDGVCRRAGETISHRGLVCLVSDLLAGNREAMMQSLIQLTHRGHDVLVFHILDEDELTFPFEGNTRFVGIEETGQVTGEARNLRDGYLDAVRDYIRFVRRECIRHRIDYATVNTSDPLGAVLAQFLARREAMGHRTVGRRS
jgi:uncharacterized protein (DUF58 family)